ncbi:hypothetical protein EV426DRAFT_590240 [Tirmania nivea]|nr:hypothetical protein EV426DRAFT_590240 [Tirmania nivea]
MYLYYLAVITVLLVTLSFQVVKTTTTTTTITTPTTITTTTTTTKTIIMAKTTITTSIITYGDASATQTIDLDVVLQRSIDSQVLAETKAERVLQYCIKQSKYQPAAHQLCTGSELPPFLTRGRGQGWGGGLRLNVAQALWSTIPVPVASSSDHLHVLVKKKAYRFCKAASCTSRTCYICTYCKFPYCLLCI